MAHVNLLYLMVLFGPYPFPAGFSSITHIYSIADVCAIYVYIIWEAICAKIINR